MWCACLCRECQGVAVSTHSVLPAVLTPVAHASPEGTLAQYILPDLFAT